MAAKKKGQGYNLAQLDTFTKSVNGADVVIKHPITEEPIGPKGSYLSFKVLGPASPQYRRAQAGIMKSLLKKQNAGKKTNDLNEILDDDDYEKQNLEVVLSCVTGWQNLYFDPDGDDDTDVELEFSREHLHMVMVHCPWMRRQLESFIVDERNFMNG